MNNRKAKRHFNKMHRQTTRAIHKILKECGPWDYKFFMEILRLMLVGIQDYYKNGYKVFAIDDSEFKPEQPSRYEIATKLLELYNKFENCDNIKKEDICYHNFWNYFVRYITCLWD